MNVEESIRQRGRASLWDIHLDTGLDSQEILDEMAREKLRPQRIDIIVRPIPFPKTVFTFEEV